MKQTHKWINGFFWFAFAAFLSASIPHVAYFFRAYEPVDAARDWLYWLISYGIAVSIDVTIFLLSVTVASMHRQQKRGGLIFSVWLFILGLAALSWYINYKYAQHFIDTGMVSPTSLSLPWLGTLPDVNPIIASAFQALAIAYTWISDKIAADERVKTAAELKAEADELENALIEKQRIAALKRGGQVSTLTGLLDAGKTLVNHARNMSDTPGHNAAINEQDAPAKDAQNADYNAAINETGAPVKQDEPDAQNAGITPAKTELKTDESAVQTSPQITLTPDVFAVLNAYPKIGALLSTSRKTATIEEVSQALNVSVRLVKNRLQDGTLKHPPRNDKLVLITSVVTWAKTLLTPAQNAGKTETSAPVKQDEPDAQNAGITLGIIEQRMYDALMSEPENVAELLRLSQEQDITSFTAMLKKRYSQYASYITPGRVINVLAYARKQHAAKLYAVTPAQNGHSTEPITDALVSLNTNGKAS